jgi:hypothetical protein
MSFSQEIHMKIPVFIKALARICDKESSRFALGGIECKSDGKIAQLTATDGRILATVHYPDEDGKAFTAIAPAKELSNGPAAAYKAGVQYDGKFVGTGKDKTSVEPLDGRFPRYEDIFTIHDQPDGYVAVKVDAALLAKLCALSHAMNDDQHKGKGITLFVKDSQSCVFAATTSEDGKHVARLAIMPLAADEEGYKHVFSARPGAESGNTESPRCAIEVNVRNKTARKIDGPPAPPPEFMDDEAVGACVNDETPALGGLVDCEPLA